jgi:hypothetical protein
MKRIVWFATLVAALLLLAAAPADAMPQQAAPITTAGVSPDGCKNFTEQAHYTGAIPYTSPVEYWNYTPYFTDNFHYTSNGRPCQNIMIKNLRINGWACGRYATVHAMWYDAAYGVNDMMSSLILPTCTTSYTVLFHGPYSSAGIFVGGRWMVTVQDFPDSIDATMTIEADAGS